MTTATTKPRLASDLEAENTRLRAELGRARVTAILDAIAECEAYSERAREHAVTLLDDAIGNMFRRRAEGADDVRNRLRAKVTE